MASGQGNSPEGKNVVGKKRRGQERSAPAEFRVSSGQEEMIVARNMGRTALCTQIPRMQGAGLAVYASSPHHVSLLISPLVHSC